MHYQAQQIKQNEDPPAITCDVTLAVIKHGATDVLTRSGWLGKTKNGTGCTLRDHTSASVEYGGIGLKE